MKNNINKTFDRNAKGLNEAIQLAYQNKLALYLYPDNITVRQPAEEDCYLRYTQIIESEYYNSFEDFEKEIIELIN